MNGLQSPFNRSPYEILLSVDVAGQPGQVPQVAQAFRESGAHFVNHYGAWVVEPLSA